MKLYKLNYNNDVVEFDIVKDTPKMYFYVYPNSSVHNGVRKSVVDVPQMEASIHGQMATSISILKKIVIEVANHDYEFHKSQLQHLKKINDDLISKLSQIKSE